jgi:hypothetical protein
VPRCYSWSQTSPARRHTKIVAVSTRVKPGSRCPRRSPPVNQSP